MSEPRQPLTRKQRELLEFIVDHARTLGYQPSYREIMEHFGFESPSGVSCHMHALEKKGYIKRPQGDRSRSIEIVGMGNREAAVRELIRLAKKSLDFIGDGDEERIALIEEIEEVAAIAERKIP